MIATGPTLAKAQWLAVELETIAKQYYLTLCIGGPVILGDAEIAHVQERFKSYGPRPKVGTRQREQGRGAQEKEEEGLSVAAARGPVRPRRRRRRRQRCRDRARRRRARPQGAAVRAGRSGARHLLAQRQAGPWRPALPRILRVPAGPRGADRARGAAAGGAAHHLADALRPAARARHASSLARPAGSVPLRPSGRPQAAAGDEVAEPAPRPGGPAAQARIPQGLRVFRLLGRRCPAGRPQRARCP